MLPLPISRIATATSALLLFATSLSTFSACTAQPTEHRAGPRNAIPIRDELRSAAPPQSQSATLDSRDESHCRRVERPKHAVHVCGS